MPYMRARTSRSLVNQFEPLLDPIQSLFVMIEALIGRCDVSMEKRQVTAHSRDMLFEGSNALGQTIYFALNRLETRAQSAQMFEDQVFDILNHAFGSGWRCAILAFASRRAAHESSQEL